MGKLKIILLAILLILAAIGAFMVFGLVAAVVQYLFLFGILLLAGFVLFKALKGKDSPQLGMKSPEMELEEARLVLEEMKRRQLTK